MIALSYVLTFMFGVCFGFMVLCAAVINLDPRTDKYQNKVAGK